MILINLKLQNFKKYQNYEITFSEGLTGIIGRNGSGKSTIFEAIFFALYGEFKNKGYKEIIRNSKALVKDPVVVELEFEFNNVLYSVIRSFRGKTLSAGAKLFKNGELISSSVKEVSRSIVKLTKMSKDAFLHTLFASQKELASLSSLKNEERKKMIRKLLGLEKIDFIEKHLIEMLRELRREVKVFESILMSHEEITIKEKLIEKFKLEKKEIAGKIDQKTKTLEILKVKALENKKELTFLQKTKEEKEILNNSLKLINNNITLGIKSEKKLQDELKELIQKQKALEKFKGLKEEYQTLIKALENQEKLKEYYLKKEGLVKERDQLRVQYQKQKTEIKELTKSIEDLEKLLKNELDLKQDLNLTAELISEIEKPERALRDKIAGENNLIKDTQKKIEKIQSLGKESNCPTCTRPLLDEYDNVLNSLYNLIENSYKTDIKSYESELAEVLSQKNSFLKQKNDIEQNLKNLVRQLAIKKQNSINLEKSKEYLNKIKKHGEKNNEEIEKLAKYIYDKDEHQNLQMKFHQKKEQHEQMIKLETVLTRVPIVEKELVENSEKKEQLKKEYESTEKEFNKIIYDEKNHQDKKEAFEIILQEKDNEQTILHELKVSKTKKEAEIKTVQNALNHNHKQKQKLQSKINDLNDYEKIKASLAEFKTKINSKIAPRISQIASEMYSQITKGKYQHIEVSNDFDFLIYDEGKKYPIERFSGGEIDLANLVLRIAISKTLNELSGASAIGFLAFDEIFGSQDESRRMMILEAFHMIKEQYRQIFLISHEMEIKEMLEKVVEL